MTMEVAVEVSQDLALEKVRAYIQAADLTPVVNRLVSIDGWPKKSALKAVQLYRNYLFLRKKYKDYELPPSYEIDEAWHAHILHTEDYMKFCQLVFGTYLHHHPHIVSQNGDFKKLNQLFEMTQTLHKKEFGDYLYHFKRRPLRIKKSLTKFFEV